MEKTDAIKLLAIDDKPDNLTTLRAVVREALPQTLVLTATNGRAGIELAAAEDPDVILLDIVMPGMDGFEVCRRLKADDRLKDIPVVFLTALKTDTASRVKALEVGGEGFLAKPLETTELTAQIRAMTKVKAANRSQRTEKGRLEALVAERTADLRESEAHFRAANDASLDALLLLRSERNETGEVSDFIFVDLNRRAEEMLRMNREQLLGKRLCETLPINREAGFFDKYKRVVDTGIPLEEEFYLPETHVPAAWYYHQVVKVDDGIFICHRDITERKQAEESLRLAEETVRGIIGASPYAIQLLDPEGYTVQTNPAFERLFLAIPPPDHSILNDPNFAPSSPGHKLMARFAKGERVSFPEHLYNTRHISPHLPDNPVWIHAEGFSLFDAEGRVKNLVLIHEDITERKKAEEQLRFQAEIIDNSPVIAAYHDRELNVVWVNKAYQKATGLSLEEVRGKKCHDVWNLSGPCRGCPVNTAIETGENAAHELTPDNQDHWPETQGYWLSQASPVRDEQGAVIGALEFAIDITERKRADAKLAASEEKYRSLFNQSTEGIYLHDLEGRILDVNEMACKQSGYSREEWLGLTVFDGHSSKSKTKHQRAEILQAWSQWAPEQRSTLEAEHQRKDGTVYPVEISTGIVRYGDSNAVLAIVTDITERKQADNYREMGQEILQILNEPGDLQESIQRILDVLKTRTGADAVGMRLQEGDDFPYFVQDGFSKDFLLTENTLVERGKDGGVCRDKDGNVKLECTCGLVISGNTDPANPLFTKGGSCWTNDSFPLLDLPSDQDPRLHPRNNCIHQGYASVALIPVRTSDRIVGLIQLNDKRKGRFTLETIEILEGIAAHMGSALMRKRAEDELREIKYLYERLAAESRTIAWKVDTAGLYTYVSPMIAEVLGYRQEEIVGKLHFYDLHPEEGREAFKEKTFATTRRKEAFVNLDNELVCKDGSVVWVTTNARPILDADGSLKGYRGSDKDITEQKQAAQELVRLSTAIEQAAEVVVITDTQGTIQYVNPPFTQITGYTREEAIGQNPRLLKSGKQDAEFYRGMWAALTAGEVFGCRMVNRRKDGTLYTVEATISPVKDASGRIFNYVAVKRDITEHLREEEERAELKSMLNQAQKMESVGRLTGGVAHDFNNLLMGIMGYTELCLEELAPDHPIRRFLDEIKAGAQRSTEITRQLMAFARKQTIAPVVLDLNDAVAGMLKLLRRLLGEDLKLTWRPGLDLPQVMLDPAQVDQILANLCINARDALAGVGETVLETGSVVIGADLCAQYPEAIPGAYVCLTVSDNGCGMDKETLAQIFYPFFTTKGVGQGTGLGLATVYGIVKQNHGFIYAYSEPGRGTTFRIFLPAIAAEDKAPVTRKAEAPRGRGETILLVEDAPSVRATCAWFLKVLGYKALEAETPEEALVIATRHGGDIHLVLTDVVMPGMDGRQLAQRISAIKPGVKVLFMSGYTADVIAQRGVMDEGVQFLSKPFTRDDLAHKVREVLEADC